MKLYKSKLASSFGLAIVFACGSPWALAEEDVEEISVIGTRSLERSASDMAVPVDVVDGDSIARQGSTRMDQMISTLVPSFNVGQQPLSDAATIVRPANMRGLAADSTLVLINGKRRHRGSVITFLAAGNNQGAHAVDLESIPSVAVDHMEVLRDGASAQYGSDAIAGVINFALKEDSDGGSLEARWGKYYQGDGENIIISANKGLPLTDRGFINLSGEYQTSKPTVRAVQRGDARGLVASGNTHVKDPVIDWGAPDIDDNYKIFANAGFEISDTAEFYAFGSYAERTVDGTFYFRNPYTRDGVFASPETTKSQDTPAPDGKTYVNVVDLRGTKLWGIDTITPTTFDRSKPFNVEYKYKDENGQDKTKMTTVIRADDVLSLPIVTDQGIPLKDGGFDERMGKGIFNDPLDRKYLDYLQYLAQRTRGDCPQVEQMIDPETGSQDLSALTNENCYAFIERFPGGFTPRFGADVEDKSIAFGIRGGEQGKLTYDASFVWGEHESDFFIYRTINPQLIALKGNIPTHYDPGTYIETDYTANLDFTTEFELAGFASPVHMGFGLEYRKEEFEIKGGDANSTAITYREEDGEVKFPDLGIGSNGFVGFRDSDSGKNSRASTAAYVDFEADLNEHLMGQVALRHENPDDFDSRTDGKFAMRYQATDTTAIRSSFSTGFRVPTVGQENVRNTTTAFSKGQLTDVLTIPAKDPALQILGLAPRLEEEEAQSFALGGVFDFDNWNMTVDYYHIEVDDRIAQTSRTALTELIENSLPEGQRGEGDIQEKLDDLEESVPNASAIGEVAYFQNSYDTRTEGVDIVATGTIAPFEMPMDVTFVANWTQTEVARHKDNIKQKRIRQVERGVPKVRASLTVHRVFGPWTIMARGRLYGSHIDYPTDGDKEIEVKERMLFDAEAGYSIRDDFEFIVGAENIFDTEPSSNPHSVDMGLEYAENPVIDPSGGFYYLKTRYLF